MIVIKRDGTKVKFDSEKIANAVDKAYREVYGEYDYNFSSTIAYSITYELLFGSEKTIEEISIEKIQDLVVKELKLKDKKVAEAYQQYREKRTKIRQSNTKLMKKIRSIGVETDRDNANVGNNFSSKLLRIASETNKVNNLNNMPEELAKAHENGDIYQHDLDSLNLSVNCLHVPTKEILQRGFNTGYGTIKPPRRIESAAELSCILLQSTQNDMFGGQSHPDFDNDMSIFVEPTRQEIREELKELGIANDRLEELTEKRLRKRIHQAMQGVVYNLNTMHSRAGSQVPFSSVNIGIPHTKDAALVCEIFLEEYEKGLGKGEQPIFPNIIFRVKDGVNREENDPYFYLFKLACRVAAKRMNPTFMNIDADFNKEYYDKGYMPATMGCVQGDEIITYKYDNKLFVESFKRMWNRFSKLFNVKIQPNNKDLYIDLKNVEIYDTKKGFVVCKRLIKNNSNNWLKVKMTNGRTLTCTTDHPFFTKNRGRVLAEDLSNNDEIIINEKQYSEETKMFDDDKAWVLGLIICDGCINNQLSVTLGLDEKELANKFIKTMKNKYNIDCELAELHRGVKGNYYEIRCKKYNTIVNDIIDLFEGVSKLERHIPNEVFSWNKTAKLNFLAGMIDADGYINNKRKMSRVQIGSTNKELSLQQMELAQSLGMKSFIYENHYSSKDRNKIRYRVEFVPTQELIDTLVCKKKKEHFENNIKSRYSTQNENVAKIKSVIKLNKEDFSYDVTTESDFFEVSGIYSHNCRTYLMGNVNGEPGCKGRGNIAPTTINLPRLGILANKDINKFFELLDNRLDLVKRALLYRYSVLKNLKVKDLPFVAGQGLMKGSEGLKPDDSIEPILKQGTYGIGFIGLAETLIALTGKHHGEDEKARKLGYKIIQHIRDYTDKTTKETHLNWSCYATPAENLSGVFVKQDKQKFGVIPGVTDKDYYTNSFHVPVYYALPITKKIDIEAPFHKMCNGGHISYVEVDDMPTEETIMDIIRYAYKNTNISYMGINFHIRYCKSCGTYLQEHQHNCPKCGSTDIQGISRVTGYLSLDERFGEGKVAERADRTAANGNKVYNK